ncbi:pilus assembly protein [Pseudoalteromonas sp. T1lg22]|uniref:pilus assembly protein n=1 Tax=Pseudoalteromonas sp. T1lg22 TaxID=2077096 RepID=UPI000CF72AA2|nr:PilC/PilY family type IV pilus protein [Pseudoalteromonas sp. T1lg22]
MKVFKKLALLCALSVPAAIHAEDIEVYVGNMGATGAKAKVLIIVDNSGSMNETVIAPPPYNTNEEYPETGAESGSGFKNDFVFYSVGIPIDEIALSDIENRSDAKRFDMLLNGCDAAKEALAKYGYFTGKMLEFSGINNGGWINLKNDNGGNMKNPVDCLADFQNDDGDNAFQSPVDTKTLIDPYLKVGPNDEYSSATHDQLKGFPSNSNYENRHKPFFGYSGETPHSQYDEYERSKMEAEFENANVVTLYSPNYIRWYIANRGNTANKDLKIEVAKNTITATLGATPDAEFALMLYNLNFPEENDRDGGRLVAGFGQDETIVNSLVTSIEGQTNTPLCETLFEAYNYFGGHAVKFGDDDTDCNVDTDGNAACAGLNYQANIPAFDTSTTIDGAGDIYKTPYTNRGGCAEDISIIYITDGAPTLDNAADVPIGALFDNYVTSQIPQITPSIKPDIDDLIKYEEVVEGENGEQLVTTKSSYLPALAHYMKKQDINQNIPGNQTATLYTVGFGGGAPEALLRKAAHEGGGKYYSATTSESLQFALDDSINKILSESSSFTAPSVASNNFDRTQTSDSVYYAMFLPTEGARWAGNLKKLKVSDGKVVDVNGVQALDGDGNIKSGNEIVTTFWSAAPDGDEVRAGGANYVLSQLSADNRNVYSNFVDYGVSLDEPDASLTASNVNKFYGNGNETVGEPIAAEKLGVSATEITGLINWARGFDVDDEDIDGQTNDTRQDIMGDPLHSRPVALTYPDGEIKIILGTNAGFVHLFSDKNNTLTEQWSFIPHELLSNLKTLRNNESGEKVYGMDGTATVYFNDKNNDGIVDDGVDTVWVFIGMRRGGNSYYAIDMSNSNAPRLMWKLDPASPGFEELGQTWSQPVVTYLKGYTYDYIDAQGNKLQKPEPILVFGAGYDTNKDTGFGVDSVGRGIYMVKASDGSLVGKFTNGDSSGGLAFEGKHSIVGEVAMLDSDYDGYTDRMYASDTGGNVWRFDMPSTDKSTWSVFHFAELSNSEILSEQRRFFYGPSVARTYYTQVKTTTIDGKEYITRQELPYEAVLVGSGNRSHPLETIESNYLYMLRDTNTITESFTEALENVPTKLTTLDLMNISGAPLEDVEPDDEDFINFEKQLGSSQGWYYSLSPTEKSLAQPTVLFGVAYFTSFTPREENDIANCVLAGGMGRLYAFNLHYGSSVYDFGHSLDLGDKIPPPPTFIVEEEFYCLNCGTDDESAPDTPDNGKLLELIGVDENDPTKTTKPGFRTIQNYIFRQEDNN